MAVASSEGVVSSMIQMVGVGVAIFATSVAPTSSKVSGGGAVGQTKSSGKAVADGAAIAVASSEGEASPIIHMVGVGVSVAWPSPAGALFCPAGAQASATRHRATSPSAAVRKTSLRAWRQRDIAKSTCNAGASGGELRASVRYAAIPAKQPAGIPRFLSPYRQPDYFPHAAHPPLRQRRGQLAASNQSIRPAAAHPSGRPV